MPLLFTAPVTVKGFKQKNKKKPYFYTRENRKLTSSLEFSQETTL